MMRRYFHGIVLLVATACSFAAIQPGHSSFMLRGKQQSLYFLPANGHAKPYAVLFLPGDAGWMGHSVDMAADIEGLGYNVYGFDVKTYLTAFTGRSTLTVEQMGEDMRTLIDHIHAVSGQPVVAAGWSQGANMAVLGAAFSKNDAHCKGVLAIGLAPSAVLGWRFVDNLTYLTKKPPDEPTFTVDKHLQDLSPLPAVMIASTGDEYVTLEATNHLAAELGDPKRIYRIAAKDHRYSDSQVEFCRAVREGMEWLSDIGSKAVSR